MEKEIERLHAQVAALSFAVQALLIATPKATAALLISDAEGALLASNLSDARREAMLQHLRELLPV